MRALSAAVALALVLGGCASQGVTPQSGTALAPLVEMQLEGTREAPIPPAALRYQIRQPERRRPLSLTAGAKIGLWAADTNFNYLLGQDATGRKTVTAIDLSQNSCYDPVALKVDSARDVWVACELTSLSATSGALQEFSNAGALQKQYLPVCPAHVKDCQSFSGYGFDSGLDAQGNVFESLNLYAIEICNPSCNTNLSAGFEWWPKGDPSIVPQLISTGDNCAPICGVGYMDVDASGNLWFNFSGYAGTAYGFGLGEITNPTKKPKLTIVEPIGTYGFFGGVYVSGKGKTLNVIDQASRTIAQYHLPLSASGKPFHTLGPTRQNAFGIGDPISGAFNKNDSKMAIGDTGGWLDIGKVSNNGWSDVASPNFYSGIDGAAYTPSDK
ncbi:MAG TPA: hypothetical protein VHX17_05610 [Candidatus Cybelea sp.]|nr:hypothetical protein [Candidatus Cybelea sp.]